MEHDFLTANWNHARRLLTTVVVAVCLTAPGSALQAAEVSGPHQSFITLDSEVQAIKAEILAINREILLLEESSSLQSGEQLIVLVSVAPDSGLSPGLIRLQLDGQLLREHKYSPGEVTALRAGGVHRLHTGLLAAGEHNLEIHLSGTRKGDKSFQQQHSTTLLKSHGRKYMELQLVPGKKKSQPELTIRQWQP